MFDRHQHLGKLILLEAANPDHAVHRVLLDLPGHPVIGIAHFERRFEMGEFIIEQAGQRFRAPLGDREHDDLADQRLAADAPGVVIPLLHHLPEFADDGAVAFGDGELAFQGAGVNRESILVAERRC